jgi:acetoin utilization protein AcuB
MRVKEFMAAPAAAVAPEDSLHVADGIMSLGGIRHLPVLSGGKVVGILSQRDVLRAPSAVAPVDGLAVDVAAMLKLIQVREVMATPPIVIGPEATLAEAAARLLEHRVGCLPVVESGALTGILTTSDILRALAGESHHGDKRAAAAGRNTAGAGLRAAAARA